MATRMYFSLVLLLIAQTSMAITFLPTLFVTKTPERMHADQSRTYIVTICKPTQYSNYSVTAQVNIPTGWIPMLGILAKIDLCIDLKCQKILATNYPKGKFNGNHFANTTYLASYVNIYVRTTAGRSNYIDWTVAVDLKPPGKHSPMWSEKTFLPEGLALESPIPKPATKPGDVEILSQIVKTSTIESVPTLGTKEYLLFFCPDIQTTQRYDVLIFVTSVDSKSAFSTYVCEKPGEACTVRSAIAYDPSGTAVNSVALHTGSGNISEVHVLVVGYGDAHEWNRFQLAAKLVPK